MGCPAQSLRATGLGGRSWRVEGCGRSAEWQCWQAPYTGFRCTESSAPTAGGHVPPSAHAEMAPSTGPQPWSAELGRQLHRALSARALSCVPGTEPIVLTIEYQLEGRAARVVEGLEPFGADQQACLRAAVDAVAIPGGLTQAVLVPIHLR